MIRQLEKDITKYQKEMDGWLAQCEVTLVHGTCEVVFEKELSFTAKMDEDKNMISLEINGKHRAYYSDTTDWIDRVENFIALYVNHL